MQRWDKTRAVAVPLPPAQDALFLAFAPENRARTGDHFNGLFYYALLR